MISFCHILGDILFFIKLEPAMILSKICTFLPSIGLKSIKRASVQKGVVRCSAPYPTSSHFSRTFHLKLPAASGIFNVSISTAVLHYQPKQNIFSLPN